MSRDNDVTIVLALNQIAALIGIFFGNACRYLYFGCLSSVARSFREIYVKNLEMSWNFYKKRIDYA